MRLGEGDISICRKFVQVLVEGIGVFGIALGEAFENGGFLALVLYPLLEKLASTNLDVSSAADISLRAICYHSGYQSVFQPTLLFLI